VSIESRSHQYGNVFGQWQIKHLLGTGSGGKSAVFQLKRKGSDWDEYCALKVISLIEEQGSFEEFSPSRQNEYKVVLEACKQAAITEVRLMAQLRGNTNIVDYLDYQFEEWSDETGFGCDLLIRMEYLSGLRAELRKGRHFDAREIVQIGKDIATALVLCHSKNILHRDIKPENIFYNANGNYKLGDFGISRILDAAPDASASTGIGTPEYAAPEQDKGVYKFLVDIYSLGIVLYELANQNRLPFAASVYAHPADITKRMVGTPLPVPTDTSPELAAVILKACAFNPKDRYQTAQELLDALTKINTDSEVVPIQNSVNEAPAQKPHIPLVVEDSENKPYSTIPAVKELVKEDYSTAPASVATNLAPGGYETVFADETIAEHLNERSANDLKQLHMCQEAASQGDADAQYELAGYYQKGFSHLLEANPTEAFNWYKKAAEQGHVEALENLAYCYLFGHGVEENEEQFVFWIYEAAKKGSAKAQHEVGRRSWQGKTEKEKRSWLKKAADQQYLPAILELAYHYAHLDKPELEQAVIWYKKAIALGDTSAMVSLGEIYFDLDNNLHDYSKAFELFRQAADQRDDAKWYLGECYYYGLAVEQDDREAFKWFSAAAEDDNLNAKLSLANCYYYGRGVDIDYDKAYSLFEETKDICTSVEMLAECYYLGRGVTQSFDEAVSLCLSLGSLLIYERAKIILGLCYCKGIGITLNTEKGFKLLESATIISYTPPKRERTSVWVNSYHDRPIDPHIHAEAAYELGRCFFTGIGTHQDYDKAKLCLECSAQIGYVQAMLLLAQCLKEGFGYYDFSSLHEASLSDDGQALDLINTWIAECQQSKKAEDLHALATYYQLSGNLPGAADYFERAAEMEHAASQYQVGMIYMNGSGRPVDLSIAATWLKRASNHGNSQAEAELGECLKKMPLFQKMKWKSANRSK